MESEKVQYNTTDDTLDFLLFLFTPQGDVVCEAASGGIALLFDWEMPKDAGAAET